jgi:hypothetical protein
MIDPKLVAKWMAEYQEIERQRKTQGLPALTVEEANRQGFQDGLQDMKEVRQGSADNLTAQHAQTVQSIQSTRERAVLWTLSMRLTILFILLAIGLATCGRLLLR